TPDFSPIQFKLDVQTVNKSLGTNISEGDLRKLLARMGHDYSNKTVFSPRCRADILHPSDLIEDVAIAIGYSNIPLQKPSEATTGTEDPVQSFYEALRETLVGSGYVEIKNFDLISEAIQTKFVNSQQRPVAMSNSFNEEYNTLRTSLLPGMLLTLKENKTQEFPQKIFEIGTAFSHDQSQEALVSEEDVLALAATDNVATYTGVKQILGTIATCLNVTIQTPEGSHNALISGRAASIEVNGEKIGVMGEIHPEVLENFQIEMPVTYLEIGIRALMQAMQAPPQGAAIHREQPAQKPEKKAQKGKPR
ncbi:MAG TPA: hypothetical protein VJ044_02370, partial [Candidatus Hodarchaeales archaeon]|nr:hypothetical protein [Candidatus Hodarchaeales archaeon]